MTLKLIATPFRKVLLKTCLRSYASSNILSISNSSVCNVLNYNSNFKSYYHTSLIRCAKGGSKGGKSGGKKGKGKNDDDDDDDDVEIILPDVKDLDAKIERITSRFIDDLSNIVFGKASTDMFNNVLINANGSKVSVSECGQVTLKSPTKMSISVFDPALTNMIANTIRDSGFGINPTVEGSNSITMTIPKPSKETRDRLIKISNKAGDKAKIDIRQVRKEGLDHLKKIKSSISEDITRKLTKEIDTLVEKKVEKISKLQKDKDNEISKS
jgi:ribosome recycling factor